MKRRKRGNSAQGKKDKKQGVEPFNPDTYRIPGRRKYKSPVDWANIVFDYFQSLKKGKSPSVSGLCVFADISRETFNQYKKLYPDTTKFAREMIKMWWIDRLSKSSPVGAIFYLKNLDPEEFKERGVGDKDNPLVGTVRITGMKITREK